MDQASAVLGDHLAVEVGVGEAEVAMREVEPEDEREQQAIVDVLIVAEPGIRIQAQLR